MNKYKISYNWQMPGDITEIEADCFDHNLIYHNFYTISLKPRRFLWFKWHETVYTLVGRISFASGVKKV